MKNHKIGVLLHTVLAVATIVFATSVHAAGWSSDIEAGTVVQGDRKGSNVRFKMSNSARPLTQQIYADWFRGDIKMRLSIKSKTYSVG